MDGVVVGERAVADGSVEFGVEVVGHFGAPEDTIAPGGSAVGFVLARAADQLVGGREGDGRLSEAVEGEAVSDRGRELVHGVERGPLAAVDLASNLGEDLRLRPRRRQRRRRHRRHRRARRAPRRTRRELRNAQTALSLSFLFLF